MEDILLEGEKWEGNAEGSFLETNQLSFFVWLFPGRHWIQLDYWMRISALFIMRMLITACEFLVRENG